MTKPGDILAAAKAFAAQTPPPAPDVVMDMRARLTHARNQYDKALKALSGLEPTVKVNAKPCRGGA